jgi:hypothetical protein
VGAEVPCGSSVAKMEGSYGVTPGDCVSCGRRRRDGGEGGRYRSVSLSSAREGGSNGNGHRPGRAGSSVLRSAPSTLPELAETNRSTQTTLAEDFLENRKNFYKILFFCCVDLKSTFRDLLPGVDMTVIYVIYACI